MLRDPTDHTLKSKLEWETEIDKVRGRRRTRLMRGREREGERARNNPRFGFFVSFKNFVSEGG